MARLRASSGWSGGANAETMRRYLEGAHHPQQARPPRVAYLAERAGEVVGFVAGHLTTRFGCDGEVQWLLVASAARGGTVGATLLGALAAWFLGEGARRVCVNVSPENAAARRLYARLGATELAEHWMVWPDIAGQTSDPQRSTMSFAIKAQISDPQAATFVFTAQKTMYGGKTIAAGDEVFVFASENEGGAGLIATGIVTAAAALPRARGVARQTPRVSITVRRTAAATRPMGRLELKSFSVWKDGRPETELNFKLYRQATNKVVGISEAAAALLRACCEGTVSNRQAPR